MNIAHLLPYSARFPLFEHNGRYKWVLRLARLQVSAGHTVTIYSSPESEDAAHPRLRWQSLPQNLGNRSLNNNALVSQAFTELSHDIYHSHFDSLHYSLAHLTKKPIVVTQHWSPDTVIAKAAREASGNKCVVVAPTEYIYQEDIRLGIPVDSVIPHGIDLGIFHRAEKPDDSRLLFVGRITKNKGVREAIEIARHNNQQLDIVGKVISTDIDYWNSIKPSKDDQQIKYLGAKDQKETARLMANAKAILFPARAPEAFGQITVEAQASGTPVIVDARARSADLIDDGKSGFIASTNEDYTTAISKLSTIDRSYCRKFAEQFDANHMATQYENLYSQLLA